MMMIDRYIILLKYYYFYHHELSAAPPSLAIRYFNSLICTKVYEGAES